MRFRHYVSPLQPVVKCNRPPFGRSLYQGTRQHATNRLIASASPCRGLRHALSSRLVIFECNTARDFSSGTELSAQRNEKKVSTSPPTDASEFKDIAVLGGGITGMASAYYLAEEFPHAKITLYESKSELGGWMRSKRVDVGDGEIIFEQGPRSLRLQAPNGTLTLRLIQDLGMIDDLLIGSKTAPAAQNRFIYYPDHLVKMPGPGQPIWDILRNYWSESVFTGVLSGVANDILTDRRPANVRDESIGQFVTRRCNKSIANNLTSAVFHGIYAGDIWKLSAKSILPLPWAREEKYGNLSTALFDALQNKTSWDFCDDLELQCKLQDGLWDPKMGEKIRMASVFMFKRGLGQFAERLEQRLASKMNVKVEKSISVVQVQKADESSLQSKIKVFSKANNRSQTSLRNCTFTHVISTLSSNALSYAVQTRTLNPLKSLQDTTHAVTVQVVNLYYRTPSLLTTLKPPGGLPRGTASTGLRGFGYLIPNSVPFSQNPERALGVIFDSDISPDLSSTIPLKKQGTRLTVMLGGHWWDDWTAYPDDEEAKEMAMAVLARHLGITEKPIVADATLQRGCIPQYEVGHSQRMAMAHEALQKTFAGRLRVAGSWYTGVGVNDCLRSAWDVVQGMKKVGEAKDEATKRTWRGATGLERFAWGRPMYKAKLTTPGEFEILELEGKDMDQFLKTVADRKRQN